MENFEYGVNEIVCDIQYIFLILFSDFSLGISHEIMQVELLHAMLGVKPTSRLENWVPTVRYQR